MRTAILSDIHGNLTAFEAVVADLRQTSPDLILHGGDLAGSGASSAEIVDRIRDLGWAGVVGNTDEMLFRAESLTEFASQSPHLHSLWTVIAEMAALAKSWAKTGLRGYAACRRFRRVIPSHWSHLRAYPSILHSECFKNAGC